MKLNLHGRLKKYRFQHALIATYNFGSRFFEDYALENFKALQDNGNVTVLIDGAEYDALIAASLDNAELFPKQANLRYLLYPIRLPGCFHPKVFLFANEKRGLLIIGSANFTQDGLSSNAEFVAAFDYEEGKTEVTLPLFHEALIFFENVAARFPSEALDSNLRELRAEVPWLAKPLPNNRAPGLPVILTNFERPLWEQLVERLPDGERVKISVLSRFFDATPSLIRPILDSTRAKKLNLYTQNGVTTLTKTWLNDPAFRRGELEIRLCSYTDEGYFQHLHGKAYAFDVGKKTFLAAGSANFTSVALMRTADAGNLEILLAYPAIPTRQFRADREFDPGGNAVVLKNPEQLYSASEKEEEPDPTSATLPHRLNEALVDEDRLTLRFEGPEPVTGLQCSVRQSNTRPFLLPLLKIKDGILSATLGPAEEKKLRSAPSIAELGTGPATNWKAWSNPLLITNLQDIVTGQEVRRQRQIREARESPQRFMDVLTALTQSGDEERLKAFLTYCDIPLDLPASLLRQRHRMSTSLNFVDTLRTLGIRNLRHFEALHDAVMDFVQRHRRRLQRLIDDGTAKSIPNFLHILLTIGNLGLRKSIASLLPWKQNRSWPLKRTAGT